MAAARIAAEAAGAELILFSSDTAKAASLAESEKITGKKLLIAEDVSVSGNTLLKAKSLFKKSAVKTFAISGCADYNIYEKPFCLKIENRFGAEIPAFIRALSDKWAFFFAGFAAFVWVVLRTGTNPKRFYYPCQQAAIPVAAAWGAGVAAFLLGGFVIRRYLKASVIVAAAVMSVYAVVNFPRHIFSAPTDPLPTWENSNPVSKIFVVDDCPQPAGSLEAGNAGVNNAYLHDEAVDMMVQLMDSKGEYFYKTAARPDGLFGANDVVIIKGNFQGFYRNTTNTDRIKGVIWKLLGHPEGFTGEIVVVDNTQLLWGNPVEGLNQQDNNSFFYNQSIVDVCNTFKAKGYPVDFRCWAGISNIRVTEYNTGNMNEGYVQPGALNSENWPKFTTPGGKHVSLRYGIWEAGAYNMQRLSVINFPVLKAHDDFGAVTCAMKNWVGVLTCDASFYNADRHAFFWAPSHLVARTHRIVRPKINFIDAEWVARQGPHNSGDVHSYAGKFIATTDPVAGDWYASSYILAQVAVAANNMNGSYVGGNTYNMLTSVSAYLNGAGVPVTMNPAQMSVYAYRELGLTPTNTPTGTNTWDPLLPTSTHTATPVFNTMRINAGGPLYNDGVNNWLADKPYAAGSWGYTGGGGTADRGGIAIGGTTMDTLYNTERYGSPSYTFDNIPNGTYSVTMKYAETWWGITGMGGGPGAGARIFDVIMEGVEITSNLDIFAQVGGNYALDITRIVTVTDGQLNITMNTDVDGGLVNAISIEVYMPPTPTMTMTAIEASPSRTNTMTATSTPTVTRTAVPVITNTQTQTQSATPSVTRSITATPSVTATPTRSVTPTMTEYEATHSETHTATLTLTANPSLTATPTQTVTEPGTTASTTPSNTQSSTPTNTAASVLTNTNTPTQTATLTNTITPTVSQTATGTPYAGTPTDTYTATMTHTALLSLTVTETASATAAQSATHTATDTPQATQTATLSVTQTVTDTQMPSVTNTPTAASTSSATATTTPTRTATSTATRTAVPETFTVTPTCTITPVPDGSVLKITSTDTYPNPVIISSGGGMSAAYYITKRCEKVSVTIYTSGYRKIITVEKQGPFSAGENTITIAGSALSDLSPGVYYAQVTAEDENGVKERGKTVVVVVLK